jgi:carboxy-terminal domain RNA polymerase II polypeptide A small phosphatase
MADAGIIASVDERGTPRAVAPPTSPRAHAAPLSPAQKLASQQQQHHNATPTSAVSASLRRIFSPAAAKQKAAEAAASLNAPTPVDPAAPVHENGSHSVEDHDAAVFGPSATARRRPLFSRLCACLSPQICASDGVERKEQDAAAARHTAAAIADLRAQLSQMEPTYEPASPLLSEAPPNLTDRPCLVLDLDETLVHSSFTPLESADFEIPLDMAGETHTVFVKKRPGVDHFLEQVTRHFEVVIFTASLSLYANPVMDLLDPSAHCHARLYREHCVLVGGCYVKDLAKLGRDLKRTIIIDNSPLSYALQPENAFPIEAFFTDESDHELEKILVLLENATHLSDVRNFKI